MRRAAAFLALLLCLYWTRAQGESAGLTENDVTQTEDQSEILGVKATSDQTNFTPNIWTELKELRDMVIVQSVELKKIEKLEQENTVLEARLNAGEKVVEEVRRENTDLKARLNTSENEVEELKRESAERKVAFSAGLTEEGNVGPFDTEIILKFSKLFTNIGQAYNPSTGFFTAPVRGNYYFRFRGWELRRDQTAGIILFHNDKPMTFPSDPVVTGGFATASNGLVLELEKGDVVYLTLPSGCSVHDNFCNHTTFSGFLLFTM